MRKQSHYSHSSLRRCPVSILGKKRPSLTSYLFRLPFPLPVIQNMKIKRREREKKKGLSVWRKNRSLNKQLKPIYGKYLAFHTSQISHSVWLRQWPCHCRILWLPLSFFLPYSLPILFFRHFLSFLFLGNILFVCSQTRGVAIIVLPLSKWNV